MNNKTKNINLNCELIFEVLERGGHAIVEK